jgi:2-oxoglutarate ferredoxin oxidoreductase subunit beta
MESLNIDDFVEEDCLNKTYGLDDYESDLPRWCKGCGSFGVLATVQKLLRDNQVPPENVVCVSGIGCSSRFPHYINTYGLHGIHGRALPLSTGVAIARPDLDVFAVMGDGDCFSIGAGHWLHAIRYNVKMTVIVLDNEIYALTKKQVSPTTQPGFVTNTTPRGAYLKGLNPLTVVLGIANASFVAQTASWLAGHLEETIAKAYAHNGLSFVRVLQRCPVFVPLGFGDAGKNFPVAFLENEDGIPVKKGFMKQAPTIQHDHTNLVKAQEIALDPIRSPIGLLFKDEEIPTYQEVRAGLKEECDKEDLMNRLNAILDQHTVER